MGAPNFSFARKFLQNRGFTDAYLQVYFCQKIFRQAKIKGWHKSLTNP